MFYSSFFNWKIWKNWKILALLQTHTSSTRPLRALRSSLHTAMAYASTEKPAYIQTKRPQAVERNYSKNLCAPTFISNFVAKA